MVSGTALISAVIWLVVAGLIFGLLWWLLGVIKLPEPFKQVAVAILAIAAVLVIINVLLTIVGHPIVAW